MTKTYSPGYNNDDSCLVCGEHLSQPHSSGCPAAAADELRDQSHDVQRTHEQVMLTGGYQRGSRDASPAAESDASPSRAPAEVSYLLLSVVYRLGAELIEMDQADQINLDEWESANELVTYLTGDADPFEADYHQPLLLPVRAQQSK